MRVVNVSDPVYAPNSKGGPVADAARAAEPLWHLDGDMVRAASTLRCDDDDWGQAGDLVRAVLDDPARDRLVANAAGHLLNGVTEPVLVRAFEYWKNVDLSLGERIEQAVRDCAVLTWADRKPAGRHRSRPRPPTAVPSSRPQALAALAASSSPPSCRSRHREPGAPSSSSGAHHVHTTGCRPGGGRPGVRRRDPTGRSLHSNVTDS